MAIKILIGFNFRRNFIFIRKMEGQTEFGFSEKQCVHCVLLQLAKDSPKVATFGRI
ncbi:hypothetical protein CCP2SC5_100037 [Azospirillaceae bacterium]